MLIDEFDFTLPDELIAQVPSRERDSSRLMVLNRASGLIEHRAFCDLPGYLRPGDVLVINNTKVYPARINGVKSGTGGSVEALLVKDKGGGSFEALVKGRVKEGLGITFDGGLTATVGEDLGGGRRIIIFACKDGLDAAIDAVGRMPLPPYISKDARGEDFDRERYQTVYASERGAVAAPTAGLHFTGGLLDSIRESGVLVAPITLHVGIGTFMPVRESVVERHVMHEEQYSISPSSADLINSARRNGGRVFAVGTTSARAIESASSSDGEVQACGGETGIFIYPGYKFKAVDALVTNFHLPKSTLLMLVCALAGKDRVLAAYAEAIRKRYRFYSYGDAMLVI
jgi:S-adenosylmethionine:tRNA ribosyltransferase-isomerase